jgi:hypothetical protein
MNLPRLLSDFQERFFAKSAECIQLIGIEYEDWHYFKQIILTVAEKLGNPNIDTYFKCMIILMHHQFKPRFWNSESFVLFLNYVDPELTKMFFYIIHGIIQHPFFGPYCVSERQNCRMKLGYVRPYELTNLEYFGFEFYDSLVEINNYFVRFIPVHRPIPFFQSRLPLCDLDVAQLRESSVAQRQKMLVISGLSGLLIRRLFCFNESELRSQTKIILLRNF